MGDNSKIEWTDASWNPIRAKNKATGHIGWYCEHATAGCANCYAETFNLRLGTGLPFKPGHRDDVILYLDKKMLRKPLEWTRPRKIFVGSMTDLFGDFVSDGDIGIIFSVMAMAPQHTFQVLTKRSDRMRTLVPQILSEPLPNVWLGVSAEDQEQWNKRVRDLKDTPATVRFVSVEPMLEHIDAAEPGAYSGHKPIHWVICGGESGPKARPMHPEWARSLRDQCMMSGVPFFMKQMWKKGPIPDDLMVREFPA